MVEPSRVTRYIRFSLSRNENRSLEFPKTRRYNYSKRFWQTKEDNGKYSTAMTENSATVSQIPSALSLPPFRGGMKLGEYRIVREIGAGGMATVWLARHLPLNRLVALKILRAEFASDERNVHRFVREARTAARLDSPAIVRIYEVGVFGNGRNRVVRSNDCLSDSHSGAFFGKLSKFFRFRSSHPHYYIAEEYVAGMNLGLYVRRRGPLASAQTLAVIRRVGTALQTAAEAGVVHRDIKPENILLSENGDIKVADFGLASFLEGGESADLSLTRIGVTLGTPLYMSPEQAEGTELDSRSDIYSLGAAAFWMLTGRPPFEGGTPMSVLFRHIGAEPPDPRRYRPEIADAVAELVLRMMAKKPEDRFSSPNALLNETVRIQKELAGDSSLGREETDSKSDIGIFTSETDGLEYTRELSALEVTRQFQNSLTSMKALGDPKLAAKRRNLRGLIFAAVLLAALGLAWGHRAFFSGSRDNESLLDYGIQRLNSVEEQWVFASQIGTSGAWRSVIQYFPRESYWSEKAERQLAISLMEEGQTEEAKHFFAEFTSGKNSGRDDSAFGLAGEAWVKAAEGKMDEASAILSRLRQSGKVYDRQTEDILAKAGELVRARRAAPSQL